MLFYNDNFQTANFNCLNYALILMLTILKFIRLIQLLFSSSSCRWTGTGEFRHWNLFSVSVKPKFHLARHDTTRHANAFWQRKTFVEHIILSCLKRQKHVKRVEVSKIVFLK